MQPRTSISLQPENTDSGPRLLTELPPWRKVFFGNLADLILRREPPKVWTTSRPAPFWPDVFVPGGLPGARLRLSALLHTLLVVLIWAGTITYTRMELQRPKLKLRDKTVYYSVSEYLPPIEDT